MVATLANKYCHKREGEQEEDSEEEEYDELDQPRDPDSADTEGGLSQSISEAPTYRSSQSVTQNSLSGSNEDDSDNSNSISEAETYRSGSNDSVEENALEGDKTHSGEPQPDEGDSVFNTRKKCFSFTDE